MATGPSRGRSRSCGAGASPADILSQRAEEFGDAPGLGDAAAGCVRSVAVGDLADLAEAGLLEMLLEVVEPCGGLGAGCGAAGVHFDIGGDERAEEPGPDGALMVGAVAAGDIAFVAAAVVRVLGRKSAKTHRGAQFAVDDLHHLAGAVAIEQGVGEADGEDLVGADGGVTLRAVDDVVEAAGIGVPELRLETTGGLGGEIAADAAAADVAEAAGELLQGAQGVMPERLDFDGLAVARGDHPVADLGVHPG